MNKQIAKLLRAAELVLAENRGNKRTTFTTREDAWLFLENTLVSLEAKKCDCVTEEMQSMAVRKGNIGLYSKDQSYGEQAEGGYADSGCPKCHGCGRILE